MTDSYVQAVNSGFTKTLAKKLGLPRPAVLRRFRAGDPLTVGPVLVLGGTPGVRDDADRVAEALLAWDLDVRQTPDDTTRWGAVVVVLTGIERPEDASAPVMALSATLRRLASNGRVVTISRAPADTDSPELAAAREGVDGFLRSLAKELRYGATGNGIQTITDNLDGTFTILETDGTSTTLSIPGGGGTGGPIAISDVTGLSEALDGKADASALTTLDSETGTALSARPQLVKVVTGSETRPTGSTSVVWYGGTEQPTNFNSANDVWLKDVVPSVIMLQSEYDLITPEAGTVYFIKAG